MHQWASALVGATAAKIVGGDAITGASTAASGTKNNFLTHWQEIQRQLAIDNKDWDKVAYWDAIDKAQNQACNELNIDFQSLPKGYWEDPQNAGLLERIAVRGQELEADPSYQNSFMVWKDREDWKAAAQQLERRGVSTDDPTYYNQLTAEYNIASEQSTNVLLFAGGESFSAIKAATEYINARSATIAAGEASGNAIKIENLAQDIKTWVGEDARLIKNSNGDTVIISKDGTRRVRFDLNNPSPHENPHGHVEELVDGKWVKSGPIYPTDVEPR